MGLTLSDAVRTAMANAVVTTVDAGIGAGLLRIYDGTRPAGPGTAVGAQTLLLEYTLGEPFGTVAAGVITLDVDPALTDQGLAAGTATWFRLVDGSGGNVGVIDGSVTATAGGGDLTINTTTVSVGLDVEVTGGTITMPAGTP